jgi:hypothetical protein
MLASGIQVTPKLRTPEDPACNPFDGHLVEELGAPFFSPNVFMHNATPPGQKKAFKWDIDQIAVLKPVDIEEMPLQEDTLALKTDQEIEARAQRAIDAFFSQQMVVPSPWTGSDKKKPMCHPMTPGTPAGSASPAVFKGHETEEEGKLHRMAHKQDASCQTYLTLPVDFDLQQVLRDYYTHQTSEEEAVQDALSTSSLRRKLFFHGDNGTPISPVKCSSQLAGHIDQESSINHFNTPQQCRSTPRHTPGSTQFSSSPIHHVDMMTPGLRRCSTAPGDLLASPQLSPIKSSGRCRPSIHQLQELATPSSIPLQATPSTGRPMELFGSPGMSPIVNNDGSYVNSPSIHISGCSNGKIRSRSHANYIKVPVPSELIPSHSPMKTDHNEDEEILHITKGAKRDLSMELEMESDFVSRNSLSENSISETSGSSLKPAKSVSCLKEPRIGFTDLFGDCKSHIGVAPEHTEPVSHLFTSQDTGYNTNSLQLTSQDTGLGSSSSHLGCQDGVLHTDLTNQFCCLPLSNNSVAADDMDLCSKAETSKLQIPNMRLHSFNPCDEDAQDIIFRGESVVSKTTCVTSSMNNVFSNGDEIILRARKALHEANNCPEDSFLQENPHPVTDYSLSPDCKTPIALSKVQPITGISAEDGVLPS